MVKILDHPVDTWKPLLTSWKSKGAPKKLPRQQKMPCGGVQLLQKIIIFLGARKPASTPTRSLSKVASRALLANSKLSWNSPSLKASNWLPSGKHTKNYGKSPFLIGKLTINGHFQ